MAIVSWVEQLDLVEQQFSEVSSILKDGEVGRIQDSMARLQALSVELLQLRSRMTAGEVSEQASASRIRALAAGLATLREVLIRRSAYVETALQIVVPSGARATYLGHGPYGNAMRQSGSLKAISA